MVEVEAQTEATFKPTAEVTATFVAPGPDLTKLTRNELEAQRTVLLWRIDVLKAEKKPKTQLIEAKKARLEAVEGELNQRQSG